MAMLDKKLPKISILGTGGTISGASKDTTDTITYQVGSLDIGAIVKEVPQLVEVADLSAEQIVNIPSTDVGNTILIRLAKRVNQLLDQPETQGVVITHGTDTLEETAFFLELTTQCYRKPVVLVGAMRPASAISSDGAFNLLQAVTVAASPKAVGRGVLIVLNDRIGAAYYTTKTNTTALDTFKANEQGYLGMFLRAEPHFYYDPSRPTGHVHFDINAIDTLPYVPILYLHSDADVALLELAIAHGAQGAVLAGTGGGSVPSSFKARLTELTEVGFPVIRASRTGSGFAVKEDGGGIGSGILNPQKARMVLMLALAQGYSLHKIRNIFALQG